FAAKINPKERGCDLSLDDIKRILEENKRIMEEAIELGGSTIRSYHPVQGIDGLMQNRLLVYGNTASCPTCGLPLRRIFLNKRSSFYCPSCQKRKRFPSVIAVTGPIHCGKSSVCAYLKDKGYPLFDCDKEITKLYSNESIAIEISKIVNADISKNGKVDKNKLRPYMKEPSIRDRVVSYLYPLLRKRAIGFLYRHKNKENVIFEVPLLKGSQLEDLIDYVLYVDAPISSRASRLRKEGRDEKALLKINSIYPIALTKKEASFTLDNSSDLAYLYSQIDNLPILK
ncbi:MAG: dephospho-CoA kinase, partial [Bacilli bacterium]|nr:dephospho-CoA kinase [Bacilli bacterium]